MARDYAMKNTIQKIEHWQRTLLLPFLLVTSAFAEDIPITYEVNGGSELEDPPDVCAEGESIILSNIETSKKGYSLKWFLDSEFGTESPETIICAEYQEIHLYAQWTPITYSITYELDETPNSPVENSNPDSYTTETSVIFQSPTRKGYTFEGWYTTSEHIVRIDSIGTGSSGDETVYAKWSDPIQYSITYHSSNYTGGDFYTIESTPKTLSPINTLGYTFEGFFDNDNLEGDPIETIPAGTIDNLDFYIKETPIDYSITYYLNDGGDESTEFSNAPTSYNIESNNITLDRPTRYGYTFIDWHSTSDTTSTTNIATKITTGSYGDKNFYAEWSLDSYTIQYELNGGVNSSYNSTSSYTITSSTITLYDPSRTGYDFEGWFTTEDFETGTEITSIPKGSTGNKILYAKWAPINYNIAYYLNDDGDETTEFSSVPVSYNIESDDITLDRPTRTGYTFVDWHSTSSTTSTTNIVTAIVTGSYGDKNFYAEWSTDGYSVKYYLNGGTNSSYNPTTYTIKSSTITLYNPSRTGYDFEGWFTTEDFETGTEITSIPKGSTGNKILYAKWTPITYTITYVLGGTENAPITSNLNPTTYTIESETIYLTDATREGYTFNGWIDGNYNSVTSIKSGSTGNLYLYADWSTDGYKITYNLNGGHEGYYPNPISYDINSDFYFEDPEREFYTFEGWFTDPYFENQISRVTLGSTGDLQLYAKWSLDFYTITYYLDGGTNSASNPAKYTYLDNFSFKAPEKEGYDFIGWYKDVFDDEEITQVVRNNPQGNLYLYARWNLHEYGIYYMLDGGTNNIGNPSSYSIHDQIELKEPFKIGHTFAGWYTDESFENKVDSIYGTTKKPVYLYAKWSQDIYTITYDLDDGINNDSNAVTYSLGDTVTFTTPSYKGYTFLGWYQDRYFEKRIFGLSKSSMGDTTIYAKWRTNTYSIIYHMNGGLNSEYNPYSYTINSNFFLEDPYRKGYEFQGWYTDSLYTNKITRITTGSSENIELYAKWSIISYSISYKLDGGENSPENPDNYRIDSAKVLLPATKTGYTFGGWYLDSAKTQKISRIASGNTGEMTLYAKWNINTYTVIFLNYDNHRIDTQTVPYGGEAEEPEVPERDGYTFIGWNTAFDNITSDTEVYATYEKIDAKENIASMRHANPFTVAVNRNTVSIINARIGAGVKLFDMQGRLLKSLNISKEQETLSITAPGSYIVRIGTYGKKITIR